jgi:hypothetical protein
MTSLPGLLEALTAAPPNSVVPASSTPLLDPEPGSGALGLDPPDTEKPVTELSALEVLFASEAGLHRYRDAHSLTGRPDHQFLSSLPYEAARVLGARLLSDRRDTGRVRRLLWDSSALVRGAASRQATDISQRRQPEAARALSRPAR